MYATTYHRPTSLAEAASLYASSEEPLYISGGHTLLPTMKARLAAPKHLIDLRHIPELKGIEVGGGRITIKGGVTHAEVANSAEIKSAAPTLAALAGTIGDAHVRHLGTIGGSVANNDPAADYPSAVVALNGTVHTDRRDLPAGEFFVGLYSTALEEGEILTGVTFVVPETAGYAKFRNPASRYPMAGAFVARHTDGSVRVAVIGAGNDGVFRWQAAEEALAADFTPDAVRGLTVDPDDMLGDIHGAPDYRANLVAVMTRRAVENLGGAVATL